MSGAEAPVLCRTDGGIAEVILNRPRARNALSRPLIAGLDATLHRLAGDGTVRVVILAGAGGHFAAGADLKDMASMTADEAVVEDFAGCSAALPHLPCPVVAAVEGVALGGGCELVEMADIVIAGRSARFGHPEVTAGTMPGAGGTQRLPRAVGPALALDLLLTGRSLTAGEALSAGLVSRVVEDGQALDTARTVARHLSALSAPVLRAVKAAVRRGQEVPLSQGLAEERRLFHRTFALDDRREGMAAFAEKRPPRFRHR